MGLLLVIVGCGPPSPDALSEEDAAAIAELDERFRQSILEKDWTALASLYTEDAVLMPPNLAEVIGRGVIVDWFSKSGLEIKVFTTASASIDGVNNLAYNRGTFSMTFVPPGSADPVSEIGKYLWIVRKGPDGIWRISTDIWNSDAPPPGPDS
jgi:ketosteroid isomerase-like protein